MKKVGVIPARFGSSRLPGKPLLEIKGKPMVQLVYEQALKAELDDVVVATDDRRILDCVEGFGGKAVLTDRNHSSGSDRVMEAARKLGLENGDIIVNIQGDEPFIPPIMVKQVLNCFADARVELATLASQIEDEEQLFNPNQPKVLINKKGFAAYFSRSPLPYVRDVKEAAWLETQKFYKHIGLYAYRFQALKEICEYAPGSWEQSEKLEQLRWLENGLSIKVAITTFESMGIDTPKDLEQANKI